MDNSKVLVVLSGGMDSAVLLYHTNQTHNVVGAVNFNYGSKHNEQERKRAKKLCENLGVKLYEVNLDFIAENFKSDLLKSGGEIPEGHYADENMKKTVVPFRNGIMLSIAAGLAESLEADAIGLGNHFGDHAVYPDCRADFIKPMAEAIQNGTWKQIKLYAPFTGLTKTDLARMGSEIGVPFEDTYSCYKGQDNHCGKCGTCVERIEAFTESGVTDPVKFEEV